MPEFEKYANESPEAARRRISKNLKAKGNPDAVKTKSDLLADNLGSTIKNMGY